MSNFLLIEIFDAKLVASGIKMFLNGLGIETACLDSKSSISLTSQSGGLGNQTQIVTSVHGQLDNITHDKSTNTLSSRSGQLIILEEHLESFAPEHHGMHRGLDSALDCCADVSTQQLEGQWHCQWGLHSQPVVVAVIAAVVGVVGVVVVDVVVGGGVAAAAAAAS